MVDKLVKVLGENRFLRWKSYNSFGFTEPLLTYSAFLLLGVAVYYWFSGYVGDELEDYLLPWLEYIQGSGRWSALKDRFHDYTGPYVTLLVLFSYLDGALSNVQIIKLLSICGVFAASAIVWKAVKDLSDSRVAPAIAAGAIFFIPTVAVNATLWGQADIYYTALLLLSFVLLLKNRIVFAVILFGFSVSFKLQGIFFAPFLLAVLLNRKAPISYLLLIPVAYFVANVPLLLAGRDFIDVATIYLMQSGVYEKLALQAPNPWFWIHGILNDFPALQGFLYPYLVAFGLFLATVAGVAIASVGFRTRKFSTYQSILLATFCVALMPYLLPKMHDRYFFAADLFSLFLMINCWRLWPVALAFQLGSLLSYIPYFFNFTGNEVLIVGGPLIGSVFISYAVVVLASLVAIEFRLLGVELSRKIRSLLAKVGISPSMEGSH